MNLEQLRVIQTIVQEGTFRGAAVRLNKSQPAVSALVKNLEEALGLPIFSRQSYRPQLTREGKAIVNQAAVVLEETQKLTELAQRLSGLEEAEVRLAVNNIFPLQGLLGLLKAVDGQYPATQITLTNDSMGGAMERLTKGEAEVAITLETGLDATRMEAVPMNVVRIIPVARPDYGPALRQGSQNARDVRGDVQVIVADSSISSQKQTLDVITHARHWTVTDFASKKEIIMAGMGWGGLPEHWVADELADGSLVRVLIQGFPIRHAQLFAIRRTDQPQGVVARTLWDALTQIKQNQHLTGAWPL